MGEFSFTVGEETKRYRTVPPVYGLSTSQVGREVMYIATIPPSFDVVNRCSHCGHGDVQEQIAHSVAQAVQFGWLEEIE